MKTFRDNAGRVWNVAIDANAIREVRSRLDINLLSLPERDFELLTRLTTDLVLLVDVLFVVCRRQAESLGVSDEQFGQAIAENRHSAASGPGNSSSNVPGSAASTPAR